MFSDQMSLYLIKTRLNVTSSFYCKNELTYIRDFEAG